MGHSHGFKLGLNNLIVSESRRVATFSAAGWAVLDMDRGLLELWWGLVKIHSIGRTLVGNGVLMVNLGKGRMGWCVWRRTRSNKDSSPAVDKRVAIVVTKHWACWLLEASVVSIVFGTEDTAAGCTGDTMVVVHGGNFVRLLNSGYNNNSKKGTLAWNEKACDFR